MALDLVNYEEKTRAAVQAFWSKRAAAKQKQVDAGKTDQGERAGVTSGKNMDGFVALILDLVRANGLDHAQIHQQRAALTLPGYFPPTKLWDLLVVHEGELVAAIELKSQVGPVLRQQLQQPHRRSDRHGARSLDRLSGRRVRPATSPLCRLADAG